MNKLWNQIKLLKVNISNLLSYSSSILMHSIWESSSICAAIRGKMHCVHIVLSYIFDRFGCKSIYRIISHMTSLNYRKYRFKAIWTSRVGLIFSNFRRIVFISKFFRGTTKYYYGAKSSSVIILILLRTVLQRVKESKWWLNNCII